MTPKAELARSRLCGSDDDVTGTLHVETEANTEAAGFETESEAKTIACETEVEAEAVYLETEAEAQCSWSVFLADSTNGRASASVLRPSVCL